MITVGVKNKMAESKCREIYDKVGFFCLISDLSASFDIKMRQINSFLGQITEKIIVIFSSFLIQLSQIITIFATVILAESPRLG